MAVLEYGYLANCLLLKASSPDITPKGRCLRRHAEALRQDFLRHPGDKPLRTEEFIGLLSAECAI
jgi:hypothetical protein